MTSTTRHQPHYFGVLPDIDAGPKAHADYLEAQTLVLREELSREWYVAALHRQSDGVSEADLRTAVTATYDELAYRSSVLNSSGSRKYPFGLDDRAEIIKPPTKSNGLVYRFLLAISFWNMHSTTRTLAGVDPTKTFERVCAIALYYFLGVGAFKLPSGTVMFGTSATPDTGVRVRFRQQVQALVDGLDCEVGWKTTAVAPGGGDGGLDIAAWRSFPDQRQGALVIFAQCKTGQNWESQIGSLSPAAWWNTYIQPRCYVEPTPAYMVPVDIDHDTWPNTLLRMNGPSRGILFDRPRIAACTISLANSVRRECETWLREALKRARMSP